MKTHSVVSPLRQLPPLEPPRARRVAVVLDEGGEVAEVDAQRVVVAVHLGHSDAVGGGDHAIADYGEALRAAHVDHAALH